MPIRMKSDAELTERFRLELSWAGTKSYEWHLGEVLYRGNPISYANMTASERAALLKVQQWATQEICNSFKWGEFNPLRCARTQGHAGDHSYVIIHDLQTMLD